MINADHHLKIERHSDGYALAWELVNERSSAELLFRLAFPLVLETTESDSLTLDGRRHHGLYQQCQPSEGAIVGLAELTASGSRYRLEDRWFQVDELTWRVDRQLEIVALEEKVRVSFVAGAEPGVKFFLL